jgi:hypothetical protein
MNSSGTYVEEEHMFLQKFNNELKKEMIDELIKWDGGFPSFDQFIINKMKDDNERLIAMRFNLWKADQFEQFPIVVNDHVLNMIGYSTKEHFMRELLKEFEDGNGTDWCLNDITNTLKITMETLKSMAIKSYTSIGKKTRTYIVALENVYVAYSEASRIWELRKINNLIEAKDKEIMAYKQQIEDSHLSFTNKEAMETLYIFSNEVDEGKNLFKIGKTIDNKADKRVKKQQTGASYKLKIVLELKCINCKITEDVIHAVLRYNGWHHHGEWFRAPIDKIRGICIGLNEVANVSLRVNDATEEEILETMCKNVKQYLDCSDINQEKSTECHSEKTVTNPNEVENKALVDIQANIVRFVQETYIKTKQEKIGIKSIDVANDYSIWAKKNGLTGLNGRLSHKCKALLDVAFKGQTLDRKRRRFRNSFGQVSGWGGWVKKNV